MSWLLVGLVGRDWLVFSVFSLEVVYVWFFGLGCRLCTGVLLS